MRNRLQVIDVGLGYPNIDRKRVMLHHLYKREYYYKEEMVLVVGHYNVDVLTVLPLEYIHEILHACNSISELNSLINNNENLSDMLLLISDTLTVLDMEVIEELCIEHNFKLMLELSTSIGALKDRPLWKNRLDIYDLLMLIISIDELYIINKGN